MQPIKSYINITTLILLNFINLQAQSRVTPKPVEHPEGYKISINHIKKLLQVRICFNHAPNSLYATSRKAKDMIENIAWENHTGKRMIHQKNGVIKLPKNHQGCLEYQVNSQLIQNDSNRNRLNSQHPNDTILAIDYVIWKRSDFSKSSQTTVEFSHPTGVNVSAPWKLLSRQNNTTRYLIKYTPDSWMGYIAFGSFEVEDFQYKNSQFRLALINGTNAFDKQRIIHWIKQMAGSVAKISSGFPIQSTQLIVVMQKGSQGAVPWGQVNRAGGNGVLFIINPEKSNDELMSDWTAAHEFSHLLLPYTPDDRWLSEGFASYHQNISRARSGLLDEKSAWRQLLAGFERGRKSARSKNSTVLTKASHQNTMQMYWGGAVLALKADVALQEQTHGNFTLSKVLQQLSECCLEQKQEWTAQEVFARLDKISNTAVFSTLYFQEARKKQYPLYKNLLKELGITANKQGQIYLDDNAPKAVLRKRIING